MPSLSSAFDNSDVLDMMRGYFVSMDPRRIYRHQQRQRERQAAEEDQGLYCSVFTGMILRVGVDTMDVADPDYVPPPERACRLPTINEEVRITLEQNEMNESRELEQQEENRAEPVTQTTNEATSTGGSRHPLDTRADEPVYRPQGSPQGSNVPPPPEYTSTDPFVRRMIFIPI